MAMQRIFYDAHRDKYTAQLSTQTNLADRANFGYRSLVAHVMRKYRYIPKKPLGKDLLAKPTLEPDRAVLREFVDLARRLGFVSPEIIEMQQYPVSAFTAAEPRHSRPPIVTDGCGEPKAHRSGMPHTKPMKMIASFYR